MTTHQPKRLWINTPTAIDKPDMKTSAYRRQSAAFTMKPAEEVRFQKWRLLLGLVLYLLGVQWILLIPVVVLFVAIGLLRYVVNFVFQLPMYFVRNEYKTTSPKTVLINGCSQAAALHLARMLSEAGHRVIACDYSVHWLNPTRFSNAIDAYYTVPNPRRGVQEYVRYLCMIAENEKVDLFIPISRPEDLPFDLKTKNPLEAQGCRVYLLHPWKRLSVVASNNNDNATENNEVPNRPTRRTNHSNSEVVKNQIIQEAERLNYKDCLEYLPKLVDNLTTLQMWSHEKYTSTCFVVKGKVIAVSTVPCNPAEKPYNWDGVNEQVLKWAYVILKQLSSSPMSGALTFELVMSHEGCIFPIGCTPQIGEAVLNLISNPKMLECIVQSSDGQIPTRPFQSVGGPQRYCLYPELWETIKSPSTNQVWHLMQQMWRRKEAFYDISDPIPFFACYHLHLPFQVALQLMQGKSWVATDYITGKIVA